MRNYAIISLVVLTAALGACKNQKNISKTMPPAEPVMTAAPATAEPEAAPQTAARSTEAIISEYFDAVAHANSTLAANRSREEVLSLFASKDTPVLIVIFQEGDFKDYDEPTTINKYLEYIQLQQKNPAKVQSLVKNASGKITELELVQIK